MPAVQWWTRCTMVVSGASPPAGPERGGRVLAMPSAHRRDPMLCRVSLPLMTSGLCGDGTGPPGRPHRMPVEVDLDGTACPSRSCWTAAPEASPSSTATSATAAGPSGGWSRRSIGDTDHNGIPEVVALLDGPDGRHLALIGRHAGLYHERLVSSALRPVPEESAGATRRRSRRGRHRSRHGRPAGHRGHIAGTASVSRP